MVSVMKTLAQICCVCFALVLTTACDDAVVDTEPASSQVTLAKKGGKPGGEALGPATVTVDAGESGLAGAITDPDGAIRIGTGYDVGMDFDASNRATSSTCSGVTFGIIEVGDKGGTLTEIVIWGRDANGNQVTSGKQSLAAPHAVTPNLDFTLHVHLDNIPITRGRGKNAEHVCDVAVGDLVYDFL